MTVKNWLRGHHVYNIIKRNKLHSKGDKIKRQPSEWEKIIARETTGLISKIHKQLMQFNTRKANNPIKKWGQAYTDISPKKAYRRWTNTEKDGQHHSLSEKCKSKLQWGITSHRSEWPPLKKSANNKFRRRFIKKGNFFHHWWECK